MEAGAGGLTVAVTGPTGEIGRPFVDALERVEGVDRIRAMARRPFDPADLGWKKTEYRQGDILDRETVDELVAGANVVVHLAFIVLEATSASYDVNIDGSRNVFEAAVAAGAQRLVYTSSVAAYGFHDRGGEPLREDMPARGTDRAPYSHQKAEVERVLEEALARSSVDAYVFRPCVVAGPHSPALLDSIPYIQLGDRLPQALREAVGRIPGVAPVLPDHGVPFQVVHHDDVASALISAVLGDGSPGTYNLAAPDQLTVSDLAKELGWRAIRIPKRAVDMTADLMARVPPLEGPAGWIEAVRTPMLMDCSRAERELGWRPQHDARETLQALIAARESRPSR